MAGEDDRRRLRPVAWVGLALLLLLAASAAFFCKLGRCTGGACYEATR